MRVLFTIFPDSSHLNPMVPLAWALQSEGHEVRVAAHPSMADTVARSGLTVVPFGSGDNEMLAEMLDFNQNLHRLEAADNNMAIRGEPGEPWHEAWLSLIGALTMHTPELPELVALCREWRPDLVLWDPFYVQAAVAARDCGAAHARVLWGQDNIGWLYEQFAARPANGDPLVEGSLNWLMAPMLQEYGQEFGDDLMLGQWTIDQRPASWRVPTSIDYVPMRWVPYNGGAVVPDWVRAEPTAPRVVMTLGTSGRGRLLFKESGVSLADMTRALAELDIELVVTLDRVDPIDDLPANVRIVDYIPLNQLVPTCAAIINHGGEGSVMAAGLHEVPQLVTPVANWGEHNVAKGIVAQGNGLAVLPEELTAEHLRDQLARLLTEPRFREGAAAFHDELRRLPTPHQVVPVLEELVAKHSRRQG